jgi:hypothetical protein
MKRRLAAVLAALVIIACPVTTLAARADSGASTAAPARHFTPAQAAGFAKQVEQELASQDARVAIVFRAGRPRDQLRDGIAYTHGAFWVYGEINGADGKVYKGYAVYNLYQEDRPGLPLDQSYLKQDYPLDFMVGNQADDVGVIIPSPEMQRRILDVIRSPAYEDRLHVVKYSLVSNPFDPRYQNCTEFVLDVVASAAWQTSDYRQIKADLRAYFTPTLVHANILERTFGPLVNPRLKTDDQGGDIVTATYDSIAAFMTRYGLIERSYVLNKQ